jgi:hypothetical protein
MAHKPTKEQAAIIDAACTRRESIMVNAYAGCAKSSTLEMLAHAMPAQPALSLAFNKKIAVELERRLPPSFTVKTLNGLGHSAWSKAIGRRPELDDKKLGKLVTSTAKAVGFDLSSDQWDQVRTMVTRAQQAGVVPQTFPHQGLVEDTLEAWKELADQHYGYDVIDENVLELSRMVLTESVKLSFKGVITFDDQIYCSTMFNGVFPRFPLVTVDEAQDLSPLNHIQVARCAADRLIVAGDRKQAIYLFRGADMSSMDKLRKLRSEWIDLPLATTFRCPKGVVARQQDHAPGFTAWSANAEGKVLTWNGAESPEWSWDRVQQALPAFGSEVAMLCRNNAPLLSMAFKLLRQGIACHMLGRDIGKGLVTLAKKICPQDAMPIAECVSTITSWMERESALARANGKDEKIEGITDRGECLIAVAEGGMARNAGELREALAALFARESGKVTLSSIHRAKGLEFDLVVFLDPWRIPSKWARQAAEAGNPAQLQQEMNLRYVGETRTKHTLVMANVQDFA